MRADGTSVGHDLAVVDFNLADLWECVADRVPEREALLAGDRRLTYAALDDRATRLAHVLADRGTAPGQHVALYLHNATEYVEAMLACFKVRAVPVNVNYRYVAEELALVLGDADAVAVITEPALAGVVEALRPAPPQLGWTLVTGPRYEEAVAAASPERDFVHRSADDHYVLYTGGTTGRPNGVVWRHEDIFFATLGGGALRVARPGPPDARQRPVVDVGNAPRGRHVGALRPTADGHDRRPRPRAG
jgi:acyl-CoA synthetase (AMP-forming)/AMP-acid ligase II